MIAFLTMMSVAMATDAPLACYSKCLQATKTFTIKNTTSDFKKLTFINGNTLMIESKTNEKLTLNCNSTATPIVDKKTWAVDSESKNPMEVIDEATLGKTPQSTYVITNTNEKLVDSKITVDPHGDIVLSDKRWEDMTLHVKCGRDGTLRADVVDVTIYRDSKKLSAYLCARYIDKSVFPPEPGEEKLPSFEKGNCPKEDVQIDLFASKMTKNSDTASAVKSNSESQKAAH